MLLTWNVTTFVSTHTTMRGLSLQALVSEDHMVVVNRSYCYRLLQAHWSMKWCICSCHVFVDLSGLTLSSSGKEVPKFSSLSVEELVDVLFSCYLRVGPLLVKDEYDYDNQQSHSSSESHLQTIQHPPSRPGPQETFSSPSLLPPPEGSSSASTSAFSTITAGPSSEKLHRDYTCSQTIMEDTLDYFYQSEIKCWQVKNICNFSVNQQI